MSFEIIQYDLKFQRDLINLWKKCGLVVPQNDPVEDIKKKLEFQPQWIFVALLDGHLIGSIMAGYDGHRGWLNYLAVHPSFQRRGYGKQLVCKAFVELRWLGFLKVNLQVRKNNSSVVEFYKHLGFKEEERISLGMRFKEQQPRLCARS